MNNTQNATSETLAVHGGARRPLPMRAKLPARVAGVAGECNASLTPRQMEAMRFIQGHFDAKMCAPSYPEMMAALGLKSKSVVAWLVNGLIERGFLVRNRMAQRNLEILRRVSVPSINGCPLYFVQNVGDRLSDSDGAPVSLSFHSGDL